MVRLLPQHLDHSLLCTKLLRVFLLPTRRGGFGWTEDHDDEVVESLTNNNDRKPAQTSQELSTGQDSTRRPQAARITALTTLAQRASVGVAVSASTA